MPAFEWQRRPTTNFGETWVPFAQIDLQDAAGRFRAVSLQIDSGAVISLLRRSVGDLLGLAIPSGRKVSLTNVGGGTTTAYVHILRTRISEAMVMPIEFAIAEIEQVPNLLGRRDVFDNLQLNFDATLQNTVICARWLDNSDKRIWDVLNETSERIARAWNQTRLPEPGDNAALQLFRRGGQLFATAVTLMKSFCMYDAPLILRALFEVSVQFEYLLQLPAERGKLFLDFAKVTRHRISKTIAQNPRGPIGLQLANSPMRAEGELRNVREYDEAAGQFQRGKNKNNLWDNWYCMSFADLTERLGKRGEYDIWYKFAAGWAHGDPFSTGRIRPYPGTGIPTLFYKCLMFYGRMLYRAADAKQIVLAAEQFELLKVCLEISD
jgi:hypothetical protein